MGHTQSGADAHDGSPRKESRPATTTYARGASAGQAGIALERVERAVGAAEVAQIIVRRQVVDALTEAGMTVRQIADVTGLSKSSVGRSSRGGEVGFALHPSTADTIRALIVEAWESPAG